MTEFVETEVVDIPVKKTDSAIVRIICDLAWRSFRRADNPYIDVYDLDSDTIDQIIDRLDREQGLKARLVKSDDDDGEPDFLILEQA